MAPVRGRAVVARVGQLIARICISSRRAACRSQCDGPCVRSNLQWPPVSALCRPFNLTGKLTLQFAGADGTDAAELARGVAAALDVLSAHGVTPAQANHGRWCRDLCEALGLAADPHVLPRRDSLAALAWDEAARAGRAAAGLTDHAAMCLAEVDESLSSALSSMIVESGA